MPLITLPANNLLIASHHEKIAAHRQKPGHTMLPATGSKRIFLLKNNRKNISQFTFPVDFAKEIILPLIIWITK